MNFTEFILIHFQCSFAQFLWNLDDDLKFPDLIGFPWTEVEWLKYRNSFSGYPDYWLLTFINWLRLPLLCTWKECPPLQYWTVLSSPSSLSPPCRCLTSHWENSYYFCRHGYKVLTDDRAPSWSSGTWDRFASRGHTCTDWALRDGPRTQTLTYCVKRLMSSSRQNLKSKCLNSNQPKSLIKWWIWKKKADILMLASSLICKFKCLNTS